MSKPENDSHNAIFHAFQSCREGLVRSVMKLCARQQDVDDILQETYIRAYNANQKSPIKSPQDYLFVVSRNLVLKGLAKQSREIAAEIDEALMGIDEKSPDMDLHYRNKLAAFSKALHSLPMKQRHAILLRKFYGLSHKEISKKMGVSVSSVEKYISGGVCRCKQSLVSQGYDLEKKLSGIAKKQGQGSEKVSFEEKL